MTPDSYLSLQFSHELIPPPPIAVAFFLTPAV